MLTNASRLPFLSALAICAVAASTSAATASAAPVASAAAAGSGNVTLTIGGNAKAAKALARGSVRVVAVAPAKKRGNRLVLPVQSITVAKSATVALRGGVRFKAGKRALLLRSLRLSLSARQATVSAKAGERRLPVFVANLPKGKAKLDRTAVTARLAGATLGLTANGATLLRARLAVAGIPAGGLGKLGVDARPRSSGGSGPGSGGSPGVPRSTPIKNEPPVLARPDGAVDITGASLNWRPRESWIQYVNSGDGTSVFGGVANGPEEVKAGSDAPLVYSFTSFPLKNGWYHPATGTAAVYFQGGVGFRHSAHGIDFSSSEPEIEINGGASRAIFRFNGTEGTKFDNQRGVLVDLHPPAIQNPPGGAVTYTDVPGTIPADTGASVFAGLYGGGESFGTLTVSFTTP